MPDLLLDVRYALRGFRKTPAFTLVTVLSLALAIGANGFVFGVLDTVVLRPFEVRGAQNLYQVRYGPRMSGSNLTTSYPAFQAPGGGVRAGRHGAICGDAVGHRHLRHGGAHGEPPREELGIRVALGARGAQVVLAAVGRPTVLLGVGSTLGLLGAVFARRLLGRIVYQADPSDPAVLVGAVLAMALIGISGCVIPALRALAVDPSRLMRDE